MKYDKEHLFIPKKYQLPGSKHNSVIATRVSQFRHDLAIYVTDKESIPKSSWLYQQTLLVNSRREIIYANNEHYIDEDQINHINKEEPWSNLESPFLVRAFGGFYVSYSPNYRYRTFPGKDRETEKYFFMQIKDIIDERGILLSYRDSSSFKIWHSIKFYKEIRDGIIEFEEELYDLYSFNKIEDNLMLD